MFLILSIKIEGVCCIVRSELVGQNLCSIFRSPTFLGPKLGPNSLFSQLVLNLLEVNTLNCGHTLLRLIVGLVGHSLALRLFWSYKFASFFTNLNSLNIQIAFFFFEKFKDVVTKMIYFISIWTNECFFIPEATIGPNLISPWILTMRKFLDFD